MVLTKITTPAEVSVNGSNSSAIETRNLNIFYGDFMAVKAVS